MAFGYYQAPFPKGQVLRGWDPQNPTKQTTALPVKKVGSKPELIYSGQIISSGNDGKWTKGVPADATKFILAFAQDSSHDFNVVNAGTLVGLSLTDSYTFATPFFRKNNDDVYSVGTRLTWCTASDTVNSTGGTAGDAVGYIKPAGANDVVIGVVKESGKERNGSINLQESFVGAIDSSSEKETAYYVIWDSAYQPKYNAES
jgi:hypothetical protein